MHSLLSCYTTKHHNLRTELSSWVFYSLSIVILFENSQEKVARLIKFMYQKGHIPFRLSVSRNSKAHYIDSQL